MSSSELTVVEEKPKAALMKLDSAPHGGGLALNDLAEVMSLGKMLAEAGYFEDVKSQAQAVVKILYGKEMGISPMASMNGLYVYKGKVCMYADLINDKIKASGVADFRVKKLTNDECILEWFDPRTKEIFGESDFTIKQAEAAQLLSKVTWKAYPKNMLFARALTFGLRLFARQVFAVTVYSVEELQDEVNPNSTIIEGAVVPAVEKKKGGGSKVAKAEQLPAPKPTASVAPVDAQQAPTTVAAPIAQAEQTENQSHIAVTSQTAQTEEEIDEAEILETEEAVEEEAAELAPPATPKASSLKWS